LLVLCHHNSHHSFKTLNTHVCLVRCKMKRTFQEEQSVSLLLLLPAECLKLISLACGHSIFSLNCVSPQVNSLIANGKGLYRLMCEFHMYYNLGQLRHPQISLALRGERLNLVQPSVLRLFSDDAGSFPKLLQYTSSLTALSIESCQKPDFLRDILPQLTALKHLSFYDSPLMTDAGQVLGTMIQLKSLVLDSCDMYTCQSLEWLTGLTKLKHLNIYPLDDLSFACVSNLTKLEFLTLRSDCLEESMGTTLTNLKGLYLDCNRDDDDGLIKPDNLVQCVPSGVTISYEPYETTVGNVFMTWYKDPEYYWSFPRSEESSDSSDDNDDYSSSG
jgi:hypothetical protein